MANEFTSLHQSFNQRRVNFYLRLLLAIPITGLLIVVLFNAPLHRVNTHFGRKIGRIVDGLSNMTGTSIAIIFSILLIASIIAVWLTYANTLEREIIVGLKFDDDQKQLTVKTKTIHGAEHARTHNYSELTWKNKKLSDGLTAKQFNTITLIKGPYIAGHIYTDHFTWDIFTLAQIEEKLKFTIGAA